MHKKFTTALLTAGLGMSILLSGCTSNASENEINGKVLTKANLENLKTFDSTGSHLLVYPNLYKEILYSYKTDVNLKKELDNYLALDGTTNPVSDLGIDAYNDELESIRMMYLQNEMFKDLLDISDKEIAEKYAENKTLKNYVAITVDREFIKKNPNVLKQYEKVLKSVKSVSDMERLNNVLAQDKQGTAEFLQYNKLSMSKLPDERQQIMNNLEKGKIVKEDTNSDVGVLFIYKYVGDSVMTKANFETQYLKDKADKKNVGELDNVMELFNKKKDSDTHFSTKLINQVKSEIKIMDELEKKAQESSDEETTESESNSPKVTDREIKNSKSIEAEVNSYTK